MNEKANRYFALAAKYRQQGRTELADALERQAQREYERGPEDINDIARDQANQEINRSPNYGGANTTPAVQPATQQPLQTNDESYNTGYALGNAVGNANENTPNTEVTLPVQQPVQDLPGGAGTGGSFAAPQVNMAPQNNMIAPVPSDKRVVPQDITSNGAGGGGSFDNVGVDLFNPDDYIALSDEEKKKKRLLQDLYLKAGFQ